jgi:ABC-2 type transport system ATP-binding protein
MSNNSCIVTVEDLTKDYGSIRAVDHISFCVREGEIFGFLGPNGAGKTTTVRMLVGLTRITSGKAYISGYDVIRDYRRVREIIGVVPDVSNLYSELTCMENLLFSAKMYGVPRSIRHSRAVELLKFFGLWKYKDVKFKNLSKGLKRRLTIASALIHDPKVLFLDEPTTGLDVMSRRALWEKLVVLRNRGVTIFLTTHNVYEAFHISDRIAIINKGRIVAIGTPQELGKMFKAGEVIEVSFQPHNPRPEEIMNNISNVISVKERTGFLEIISSNPTVSIEDLARLARINGYRITMLRLRSMDAEELFIKIIGETRNA